MENGISVIICCHNSEARIGKVLEHLELQMGLDDTPWEVVIVDNASTDLTAQQVAAYAEISKLALVVAEEAEPGLSYARLKGLATSRYPYVCFIDDDNWVCRHYIHTVCRILHTQPDVGLCGGRGIAAFENTAPDWFSDFQAAFAVGEQSARSGYLHETEAKLYGAGVAMRKSAWEKLVSNGFTYKLTGRKGKLLSSGEDSELSVAIRLAGYRLWYEDSIYFSHFMPAGRLTLPYLKKLFAAFGGADVVMKAYYTCFEPGKKLKNWFISHYLTNLIHCSYMLVKVWLGIDKSHGEFQELKKQMNIIRNQSQMFAAMKMGRSYRKMILDIRQFYAQISLVSYRNDN